MRLIILGAGKYGREIEDIASQTGLYSEIEFLDDMSEAPYVVGKCADFIRFMDGSTVFHTAFGNNEFRKKWITELKMHKAEIVSIIHPTAYISPKAKISNGTAVLPKAVINSYSVIKDVCIINTGAIVDHDCIINEFSHICVGAIVKADNCIPAKMKIEAGTVVERGKYKGE